MLNVNNFFIFPFYFILFHKYFRHLVALTANIYAVLGIGNADAIEIIVFYRSVFVNYNILNACSFELTIESDCDRQICILPQHIDIHVSLTGGIHSAFEINVGYNSTFKQLHINDLTFIALYTIGLGNLHSGHHDVAHRYRTVAKIKNKIGEAECTGIVAGRYNLYIGTLTTLCDVFTAEIDCHFAGKSLCRLRQGGEGRQQANS